MASAAADLQDFSQVFYEQLKCFICDNRLKAGKDRWYRCYTSHLVCQDCTEVQERKNCSCGKLIGNYYCKVIEAALKVDKMRFKCENLNRGCKKTSNKEDMIFHQTECIYRLVKCPRIDCKSSLIFHELMDHMKKCECIIEDHHYYIKDTFFGQEMESSSNYGSGKEDGAWDPIRLEIDQKVFLVMATIENGVFYHWIYFVGSPSEAKNFEYTIDYSKSSPICSHSDFVISINETSDSVIKNGKCFGASSIYFQEKFTDQNNSGRYIYSFKIKNLKEEAKDDNVESGISDTDE